MARKKQSHVLGIDIGGSGIKGALVDTLKGELASERHRIPTPTPSTPDAVAGVVNELVEHFNYKGRIGCTFPAIVRRGVVHSAANVDKSWIGTDADALFEEATGQSVHMLNDADAAGVAEMKFGAGKGEDGVVFMITLGTGIGTALFVDGTLVPNTELGHLELNGKEVEPRASANAKESKGLSWKKWGGRLDEYFKYLEALFSPDLFIVGGGISKKSEKFFKYIKPKAPVVAAELRNQAGIVGAAYQVTVKKTS